MDKCPYLDICVILVVSFCILKVTHTGCKVGCHVHSVGFVFFRLPGTTKFRFELSQQLDQNECTEIWKKVSVPNLGLIFVFFGVLERSNFVV